MHDREEGADVYIRLQDLNLLHRPHCCLPDRVRLENTSTQNGRETASFCTRIRFLATFPRVRFENSEGRRGRNNPLSVLAPLPLFSKCRLSTAREGRVVGAEP